MDRNVEICNNGENFLGTGGMNAQFYHCVNDTSSGQPSRSSNQPSTGSRYNALPCHRKKDGIDYSRDDIPDCGANCVAHSGLGA